MACCSYILLTFIKLLAFILPSWASEKQPIKVVFRQKNSSPIQKQGSRKNYPWVSLEVFNRFSWSRWEGVWEMPAHGHGKESLGSIPAASLQKISLPAFPPAGFWPSPPPQHFLGLGICWHRDWGVKPCPCCSSKSGVSLDQEATKGLKKNHNWSLPP